LWCDYCSGATGAAAPAAGLSEAPAQSRLGRLPKNARLIEAMAQHKNAKPKPKGWLMAVVESIYKEGERHSHTSSLQPAAPLRI
jgi:hypothetical protein